MSAHELILLACGHQAPATVTGYALDSAGQRICNACAEIQCMADMTINGVACLYLTTPPLAPDQMRSTDYRVTDWLGHYMAFNEGRVFNYSHKEHGGGFGALRQDFDFQGFDGFIWHGVVRGDMQLARCKRTKKRHNFKPAQDKAP